MHNMYKKLVLIILAGFFVFPANAALAQVTDMTVAVDGMACPFCAFGVEKRLKKVGGVAAVTVDMKTGTAKLAAGAGESIRYQDVPKGVKEAGFTAGVMQVTADGTVVTGSDSSFHFQYDDQSFLLEPGDNKIAEQLRKHARSGKTVLLQGVLRQKKGETWSVSPASVAEATQ